MVYSPSIAFISAGMLTLPLVPPTRGYLDAAWEACHLVPTAIAVALGPGSVGQAIVAGLISLLVLGLHGDDYHLQAPPWQYPGFAFWHWPGLGLVCSVVIDCLVPLK